MNSKINSGLPLSSLTNTSTVTAKAKVRTSDGAVSSSASVNRVDRVEISNEALELNVLSTKRNEPAPLDQQKVESIRSAIANGTFHVDATRIAQSLSQLEQELK